MSEFPVDIEKAIEDAVDICEQQLANPDVFNDNTLIALMKVSALAGFLKIKGAEYTLNGEKAKGSFLKANSESLDRVIAALKFKINANTRRGS